MTELEEVQDEINRHVIVKKPHAGEPGEFMSNAHLSDSRWPKYDDKVHNLRRPGGLLLRLVPFTQQRLFSFRFNPGLQLIIEAM